MVTVKLKEAIVRPGPKRFLSVCYDDWGDVGEVLIIYADGEYMSQYSPIDDKMYVLFYFSDERTLQMLQALDRMDVLYEVSDGDTPLKLYTEQPMKELYAEMNETERTVGEQWDEESEKHAFRDSALIIIAVIVAILVFISCGYFLTQVV